MRNHMLRAIQKGPPTVTVLGGNTDTTPATTYTFNYPSSVLAGTFIVVVLTGRSSVTGWTGLTDTTGNTYTEYVERAQSNGLTYTAIYYCILTNAVTSSDTLTATTSGTVANAQHATIFALTGVTGPSASGTSQPTSTSSCTVAATTTTSGFGIAINGLSTGIGTPPTVVSVSPSFTQASTRRTNNCSQYTAYSVYNAVSGTSISNTYTMSSSAVYADVIALFS